MPAPARREHTSAMEKRSGSTLVWSLGVGWLGALAIGAAGVALTVVADLAVAMLSAVGTGPSDPGGSDDITMVTVASMLLCLGVATGGGWTLAGAPQGLLPRWLAGAAAGLVGVVAGAGLFAIALDLAPF